MTPSQASLINRCIDEDFVEIGRINGVSSRTADCLVEAGLLEHDYPPFYKGPATRGYVRLRYRKEQTDES